MHSTYRIPPQKTPPLHRWQTLFLRLLFGGYFVYLTLLLLTRDPYKLVSSSTGFLYFLHMLYPFAHLISFTVLAVLALLACCPLPRLAIFLSLAGYAAATEALQGIIPPRTPAWQDLLQDLSGIAIGILILWLLTTGWKAMRNVKEEVSPEIAA